jgi:hypothetical protein
LTTLEFRRLTIADLGSDMARSAGTATGVQRNAPSTAADGASAGAPDFAV